MHSSSLNPERTYVPNAFPTITPQDYRLAVIGEAPGREEQAAGRPFVGASGRFLRALLSRAGIHPDACFFGNVSQHRPPANEIHLLNWDGKEIQDGLFCLREDLETFKPHLCLLLGNVAVKAALDHETVHPLKPGKFKHSVSNWRGSMFMGNSPFFADYKCLASYHPAAVLRQYEYAPILQFDIKKAFREARTPSLTFKPREIIIPQSIDELLFLLGTISDNPNPSIVSTDIEGYVNALSCLSFATSDQYAFIVPFSGYNGGNYWNDIEDEIRVWTEVDAILSNPRIPKVLQNGLYDRFVLQYSYNIVVRGNVDDTMLKHWELYCELEKNLGVQTSLYTDVPYYKFERKSGSIRTYHEYCCKDSLVTHEINSVLEAQLKPDAKSYNHYRFNVDLLNPLLYMELRGILYNYQAAKDRRAKILQEVYTLQHELDAITGHGPSAEGSLEAKVRALMCYKKDSSRPKADYITEFPRALELAKKETLTLAEKGELSTLLGEHLNVEAPKQFQKYLYSTLKLPLQTNHLDVPTADEKALIKLRKHTKPNDGQTPSLGFRVVSTALQIRRLGTRAQMLHIHPDEDGRIRCGYNVVGTETGRLTCYTSPTGSGYNLQTIPSEDRDLFGADADHWFFQCDLAGADGWTIGAHCKALGDPTMLEDLLTGIKPAKVLCLGLRGKTKALDPRIDRVELEEMCREVKKEDWDYFACKQGIWGTCYLMGVDLLRDLIEKNSDGILSWTRKEAYEFQRLVFLRYQVKRWHDSTARKLSQRPVLVSASGHRRVFFGRSNEILGKALSHEPQANTTYATNLAAWKLWHDPENRVMAMRNLPETGLGEGERETSNLRPLTHKLRIEPLHQVHDALCGQFRKTDTEWAVAKIRGWFDNTLMIAGQPIKIPFEGHYGPSWGEQKEGSI